MSTGPRGRPALVGFEGMSNLPGATLSRWEMVTSVVSMGSIIDVYERYMNFPVSTAFLSLLRNKTLVWIVDEID